jgi:hypothetical protein
MWAGGDGECWAQARLFLGQALLQRHEGAVSPHVPDEGVAGDVALLVEADAAEHRVELRGVEFLGDRLDLDRLVRRAVRGRRLAGPSQAADSGSSDKLASLPTGAVSRRTHTPRMPIAADSPRRQRGASTTALLRLEEACCDRLVSARLDGQHLELVLGAWLQKLRRNGKARARGRDVGS